MTHRIYICYYIDKMKNENKIKTTEGANMAKQRNAGLKKIGQDAIQVMSENESMTVLDFAMMVDLPPQHIVKCIRLYNHNAVIKY